MAKTQRPSDLEGQLRAALNEQTDTESLSAIAKAAGVDLGQIYRFARAERTLRLPSASRLASYLGLELRRVKQPSNKPQQGGKRPRAKA